MKSAVETQTPALNSASLDESTLTLAERTQRKLRLAVAAVERNLSDLSVEHSSFDERAQALGDLRGSWRTVVEVLALEPEPERRECPFCKAPIRLLATRCVHCWKKSLPA